MTEIKIMLFSYVAFLFPIAVYCLILAMVNRRVNPVMASGSWDALGLLLACSGALLICGPGIIYINFDRHGVRLVSDDHREVRHDKKPVAPPAEEEEENAAQVPAWRILWYVVWALYYVVVLAGAAMLVLKRRSRTAIYNADADIFYVVLAQVLDKRNLAHARLGRSVFIGLRPAMSAEPAGPASSTEIMAHLPSPPAMSLADLRKDGILGQIDVDPFPGMRHITMHWRRIPAHLREDIEDDLRRRLEDCRCLDNPAAGWFLSISTLLFFSVFAVIILMVIWAMAPIRR